MAELDEILIEHAKHLDNLSDFMKQQGAGLTQKQADEISAIIKKGADNMRRLALRV